VNDSGEASEVTIDTTITNAPVGTHNVAISNDAGILGNDRITNDSVVKVEKNLISEIDRLVTLLRFAIFPVIVAVDNSLVLI
jgi:hypothetical protein